MLGRIILDTKIWERWDMWPTLVECLLRGAWTRTAELPRNKRFLYLLTKWTERAVYWCNLAVSLAGEGRDSRGPRFSWRTNNNPVLPLTALTDFSACIRAGCWTSGLFFQHSPSSITKHYKSPYFQASHHAMNQRRMANNHRFVWQNMRALDTVNLSSRV
jgi:hypothetical protein